MERWGTKDLDVECVERSRAAVTRSYELLDLTSEILRKVPAQSPASHEASGPSEQQPS
jgi:hypothetical protein